MPWTTEPGGLYSPWGLKESPFPHLIYKALGEFIEELKPENLLCVSISFLNVKMRVLFQ